MNTDTQVVVIGGGILGASLLYCLAKLGWKDTLLIERRELTSGSTWHAAGNTTYFGPYAQMTRLFAGSILTYLNADADSGQWTVDSGQWTIHRLSPNGLPTGSYKPS
jgi:glycine/D-amino acid oxidase-like deaminating enzyme